MHDENMRKYPKNKKHTITQVCPDVAPT